ncbi:unnamed protein product [Leptidea sinapis]|uniref:Uncharacterized protein n=1 Tax=Leptidea sinapis TaxID=189913 RepID=A0A5E4QZX3_9NEOP|nr:unnamed protein product [Leptidea sinapis]
MCGLTPGVSVVSATLVARARLRHWAGTPTCRHSLRLQAFIFRCGDRCRARVHDRPLGTKLALPPFPHSG